MLCWIVNLKEDRPEEMLVNSGIYRSVLDLSVANLKGPVILHPVYDRRLLLLRYMSNQRV